VKALIGSLFNRSYFTPGWAAFDEKAKRIRNMGQLFMNVPDALYVAQPVICL